jgi:hypothetical protein
MNEHILRAFDEFKKNIDPFKNQWKSLDIHIIALRSEKNFKNIATTIRLLPDPHDKIHIQSNLPNLESLKVIHEVWAVEKLDNLFDSLAHGILKLENLEVHYKKNDGSPDFSPSFYKNQKGERYVSSPKDWTYYSLVSGGERFSLDRDINKKLKGLDTPYHDLQELLSDFTLLTSGYTDNSRVEVSAIFGLRILDFKWDERKALKIEIEVMPFWDPIDIDLGLIYRFQYGNTQRISQEINGLNLDQGGKAEIELSPPADFYETTVFLRAKKAVLDEITIFNPVLNPMINIYERFDKNLDRLKSGLSLIGDSSGSFEKAVENLLFLCRIFPAPFINEIKQRGRLDIRGADILALNPQEENLFVVECTTGPVEIDKLTRLLSRTQSLINMGYPANPVLFTTTTRKTLTDEISKRAQNDKISIITKEDIETLLSMAERNVPPNEVSEFIFQCIPNSQIPSYFRIRDMR